MFNVKLLSGYCVLNVDHNVIYAARGYRIFKSSDGGETWSLDGKMEDLKYSLIANTSRLLARLFRAEITDLLVLHDGSRVAIGKKGIFTAVSDGKVFKKSFTVLRGSRPLKLCEDRQGNIFFGEYFNNADRDEVHIYKSEDAGKTWNTCYTFPKNTIRHVHGVFYDEFDDLVWFATGDLDGECIIGNTKDGFGLVKIVKQGGQVYRTVQLLFYKDFIVYGTDSEYEKNHIYRIDRKDYKEHCLKDIQSAVFSAVKVGEYAAMATAVEPSTVNVDQYTHVWYSVNGTKWEELYKFEKDRFNPKYFQFGKIKFPRGAFSNGELFSTGHSLKYVDNSTIVFELKQ